MGRASANGGLAGRRPPGVVIATAWLGFPDGGAPSIRVRLIARAMLEAGATVHVLCLQPSERPPTISNHQVRGTWHDVPYEYTCRTTVRSPSFIVRRLVELRGWLQGARRLVELRRAGQADCVYLWSVFGWRRPVVVGFVRLLGVPIVMELNERPASFIEGAPLAQRLVPELAGMAGVVSISSFLTRWARTQVAERSSRLSIVEVPILVDVTEQPEGALVSALDPLVVFAGAPVYDETVVFIVRAMEHVWRHFPACRLVITGAREGDPVAVSLAKRIARETGGDDRVRLAGYLPRRDLLRLYREASALLIPLFDDVRSAARFPTKIGEYLASARPIVTTRVGEIPRHFQDGVNAFVSEADDPEAYGLKICEALSDRERASAVGVAGRAYAVTHFHYGLHGTALVRFFGEVAARAGRGPR